MSKTVSVKTPFDVVNGALRALDQQMEAIRAAMVVGDAGERSKMYPALSEPSAKPFHV